MPYIGRSLGDGVRARYIYAATSGQTTFSGNDSNGIALSYSDTLYMDVYQNGVLLKPVTDYASTTGTSVVLVTGASADDVLEMIVYDSFAVADTVSAANGGSFGGAVSVSGGFTATAGASSNAISLQSANFKMTDLNTNAFYRTGTFTPASGQFTVGNGSAFGNYIRIGDLVHVNFGFEFGSSSSFTGDVASITGLPFTVAENISGSTVSYVPIPFICWDNGAQWRQGIGQASEGSTSVDYPSIAAVANSYISASNPFTWATGDSLTFTGTYTTSDA